MQILKVIKRARTGLAEGFATHSGLEKRGKQTYDVELIGSTDLDWTLDGVPAKWRQQALELATTEL